MSVDQFAAYCAISECRRDGGDYDFLTDLENPNLEIRADSIKHRETIAGGTEIHYMVIDIRKMKSLAKLNNQYAIKHLEGAGL